MAELMFNWRCVGELYENDTTGSMTTHDGVDETI